MNITDRLDDAADVLLDSNATDEEKDRALNAIYDARDKLRRIADNN